MIKSGFYDKAIEEMLQAHPDLKTAFGLLKRAKKEKDPRAFYALGTWYLNGKYVDKNEKKGLALIKKAAKSNVPAALHDLGVYYENGRGKEKARKKDINLAMRMYVKAALYGSRQAVYEVGRCYYYGLGVKKDVNLADIWLDKARELGVNE